MGCSWACGDGTCECECDVLEVERGGGGWMSGEEGEGRDRMCANLRFEHHII